MDVRCCKNLCMQKVAPAWMISRRTTNYESFRKTEAVGKDNVRPCRKKGRDLAAKPLVDSLKRRETCFDLLRGIMESSGPAAKMPESKKYEWNFFVGPPDILETQLRIPVCTHAWALFNGFSPVLVRLCMKDLNQGVLCSNPLKKQGDEHHEECISHPEFQPQLQRGGRQWGDSKKNLARAWLKDKLDQEGCTMPTARGVVKRLPFFDATCAWMVFRAEMSIAKPGFTCSYQQFVRGKNMDKTLQAAGYRRLTGTLGKCSVCQEYKTALKGCRKNDRRREEIWLKYRGHLILQALERRSYYDRRLLAIKYPDEFLSCIVDGSTQRYHNCPMLDDHTVLSNVGDFAQIKQSLTCVHFHGRETFLFPRVPYHDKGSNWTIQCVSSALENLAKSDPDKKLPKTLFLQLDNCSGDNKNKYVFGYFSSLVSNGTFNTVVLSFLVVGHTHEDVDQLFSTIGAHLQKYGSLTLSDFDKILVEALNGKLKDRVKVIRLRATGDYKTWVEGCIDPAFQGHKVPCTFVFQADTSASGERVAVLKYKSFWCSETWYPRPVPGSTAVDDFYREISSQAEKTADRLQKALEDEAATFERDFVRRRPLRAQSTKSPSDEQSTKSPSDECSLPVVEVNDPPEPELMTFEEYDGDRLLREVISKSSNEKKSTLDVELFFGRGFLFHESEKSLSSFHASPGIIPLVMVPEFQDVGPLEPRTNDTDKSELFRSAVCELVENFGTWSIRHDEDARANGVEEWEAWFQQWPKSIDDINQEDYLIDWNSIRAREDGRMERNESSTFAVSVKDLVSDKINFQAYSQIKYSGANRAEALSRMHKELQDAVAKKALDQDSFVLVLKEVQNSENSTSLLFNRRDSLPFSLARVCSPCEADPPCGTMVQVHYWYCASGNPNNAFTEGFDEDGRRWLDSVPRESVLICDVDFATSRRSRHSRALSRESTLKPLTELGRLPGWRMEPHYGLVYQDPSLSLSVANSGDWLIVPSNRVEKVAKRFLGNSATSPILLVKVLNGSKADEHPLVARIHKVAWYSPPSGNPGELFSPLLKKITVESKASFAQVETTLQLSSVVGVAKCHRTGVVDEVGHGVRLKPLVLEALCTRSNWFMSKWSFCDGKLQLNSSVGSTTTQPSTSRKRKVIFSEPTKSPDPAKQPSSKKRIPDQKTPRLPLSRKRKSLPVSKADDPVTEVISSRKVQAVDMSAPIPRESRPTRCATKNVSYTGTRVNL